MERSLGLGKNFSRVSNTVEARMCLPGIHLIIDYRADVCVSQLEDDGFSAFSAFFITKLFNSLLAAWQVYR